MWSTIPHIPVVNPLLTGGNCPLPQQMTVNLSSFIFLYVKRKVSLDSQAYSILGDTVLEINYVNVYFLFCSIST